MPIELHLRVVLSVEIVSQCPCRAAGVLCVMEVNAAGPLFATQRNVGRVDAHHMIATIG